MADKIIQVKVSAGAKTEKMEQVSPDHFKIRVQEPPEKGKANERVLELVAEYFNIPTSRVTLKRGAASRAKTISILL